MSSREDEMTASFEEYVAARRGALLRTAYLMCGSAADAEDLVQLALVKAWPHWRRLADRPEPYVRRVLAREVAGRWRRRRWREVTTDEPPEQAAPERDRPEREAVRAALLSLAPRQRAVIVLRYFDDLTERETAEALGIAVGTVKSQARDALTRLRADLPGLIDAADEDGGDDDDAKTPPSAAARAPGPCAASSPAPRRGRR